MLGVHPDYRGAGLGRDLKLAQRDQALTLGLDLIEWTYDPLQALNAHLNFVKLGVIAEEYEENMYGESPSPLHGGLPTDRLVCQWWIRRPHVERRIRPAGVALVSQEVADAPLVNDTRLDGEWLECLGVDTSHVGPRVVADIPLDFTTMLARDPARAARWRYHVRTVFTSYLAAGFRVVDFALDRIHQRGRYLLTNIPPPVSCNP
jgi:predicted GNAT superfamily acetyltransferase